MTSLILLLAGPLQSWGERSRFTDRDTLTHPTRSGVLGLLACAAGHPRDHDLAWARDLRVSVRGDQPGLLLSDFHTVGGGYTGHARLVTAEGKRRDDAVITRRHYLTDAAFVVAVDGPRDTLDALAAALRAPHWPMFLGRKACPPSYPVLVGVSDRPGVDTLQTLPLYRAARRDGAPGRAQLWLDAPAAAHTVTTVHDDPVDFHHDRRTYRARDITLGAAELPCAGTGPTGYLALRAALTTLGAHQ